MLDKLEDILRYQCRLNKDDPILVGVSGGPDSLCLLASLHEAGWQVIAAHFNHRLRPEATEEAAAVEAIAAKMGVSFVGGEGDVRQHAEQQKLSIETAARELRYRFLFEQARRHKAQAVAVGHTADDQVETVLMHFLRGAGLNGLKGMQYRTVLKEYDDDIPLVRPLLDTWRAETVAYCEQHGLLPHFDASNDSTDFLRNRLRHELIPLLESYNPRFREAAWRTGRTLSADYELLDRFMASVVQKAMLRRMASYIELAFPEMRRQPRGLQMYILQRAARELLPDCDISFDDLQRVTAFLEDGTQERIDFIGGLFLLREGDWLYLTEDERSLPRDRWPQMPAGLDVIRFTPPFKTMLASGWSFSASPCASSDMPDAWKDANRLEAWIDAADLPHELKLRVRRDGDRIAPLGIGGHTQKLSDFFVNAKLPARARERWPLVCAGNEVIWLPGYRPAERVRVREQTRQVLHLKMLPPNARSD